MKDGLKKLWDSWAGIFILTFLLMLVGSLLLSIPEEAINGSSLANDPVWITVEDYASFLGIWILTLIYYVGSKRDRWLLPLVGKGSKGNTVLMLLLGLLLGFAMNGGCIWIASAHGDFALQAATVSAPAIALIFLCVFIQSSAEELLCRNLMYQKLNARYGKPIVAILGNALFFAALHLFNTGLTVLSVVDLVLCGIMMSVIVWATDSLWMVFGVHTMWNFTQNIIFGLPNSGRMVPYTIFTLVEGSGKDSFAYSASFGIEGGLLSCAVFVLVTIVFYVIGRGKGRKLL